MDEGVEVVAGELGGGHGHGGQGGQGGHLVGRGSTGHTQRPAGDILLYTIFHTPAPAVAQRVEVVESLAAGVAELGAGARVPVVVPQWIMDIIY